jgi:RNA polymerase sigma-70 factor (ECF subfamily)
LAPAKPHPAEAFRTRSLEHLDALYNFALHQSSDSSAAQKLVVKTYQRAGSRFERVSEGTDFKLWIFKVMRDAAIRLRRNGWSKRVAPEPNGEIDPGLAKLPETHRLAMVLYAVEGFTFHDIADILGSRPGTVVVWLDEARRRLELDDPQRF